MAVLGMFGVGVVVFGLSQLVGVRGRFWTWAAQAALWSLVLGLGGYLYYGLGLPGSSYLEDVKPGLRGLLIGLVCGLLPVLILPWLAYRARRRR
jgi:hypothetical protein